MSFEEAFTKVVGLEGRYSDHPSDSGARPCTASQKRWRAYGYTGRCATCHWPWRTRSTRERYWDKLRLDRCVIAGARVADGSSTPQ